MRIEVSLGTVPCAASSVRRTEKSAATFDSEQWAVLRREWKAAEMPRRAPRERLTSPSLVPPDLALLPFLMFMLEEIPMRQEVSPMVRSDASAAESCRAPRNRAKLLLAPCSAIRLQLTGPHE